MNIKDTIRRHEGVRIKTYKDSLGIPTIGVGFNLERAGAREAIAAVGADYDKVLAGTQDLTDAQIDTLLDHDIADCVRDLHTLFPGFDQMPANVQMVLTDMRFQLGPNRLRGFANSMAAIGRGDYKDAAARLQSSKWAEQVPKRAAENIQLLLTAHK